METNDDNTKPEMNRSKVVRRRPQEGSSISGHLSAAERNTRESSLLDLDSRLKPVVVRYPRLDPDDPSSIVELMRCIERGSRELGKPLGINSRDPEKRRVWLLKIVGQVITKKKLAPILATNNDKEKTAGAEQIISEVSEALFTDLLPHRSESRPGPKSDPERDEKIYRMKRGGLSYSQLATRLNPRMSREGVRSACRRFDKRLKMAWEETRSLMDLLKSFGISFEEEDDPPKTT